MKYAGRTHRWSSSRLVCSFSSSSNRSCEIVFVFIVYREKTHMKRKRKQSEIKQNQGASAEERKTSIRCGFYDRRKEFRVVITNRLLCTNIYRRERKQLNSAKRERETSFRLFGCCIVRGGPRVNCEPSLVSSSRNRLWELFHAARTVSFARGERPLSHVVIPPQTRRAFTKTPTGGLFSARSLLTMTANCLCFTGGEKIVTAVAFNEIDAL